MRRQAGAASSWRSQSGTNRSERGCQARRPYCINTAAAINTTGITPATITHTRYIRSSAMARTSLPMSGTLHPATAGWHVQSVPRTTKRINEARLPVSLSLEHLQLNLVCEVAKVHSQSVEHFALRLIGSQIPDQGGFCCVPPQLFDGCQIVLHGPPLARLPWIGRMELALSNVK